MSTGKINITVLGGMCDGAVYTMPLDTRALKLTFTGEVRDAVTHICVRGEDGNAYALHPVTGLDRLAAINQSHRIALAAALGPEMASGEGSDEHT